MSYRPVVNTPSPADVGVRRTPRDNKSPLNLGLVLRGIKSRRGLSCAVVLVGLLALVVSIQSGGLATMASTIAGYASSQSSDAGLSVTEVEVVGAMRVSINAVRDATGITSGTAMADVEILEVKQRVETVNWVRRATVERRYPDRIIVQVTERNPAALWQVGGVIWLIDEEGVAITHDDLGEFASLPMVVGAGADRVIAEVIAMQRTEPELSARIYAAVRVGERRWDIAFDNGIRLKLPADGNGESPSDTWRRFAELERQHRLLEREAAVYDLRIRDQIVVRLTPEGEEMLKLGGAPT